MAKRSGTEAQTASTSDGPEAKRPWGSQAQQNGAENEMGEFEDQWEDELESDEEVVDADAEAEDGACVFLFHKHEVYLDVVLTPR